MRDNVTLFTDGGSRGNPGPAGAGAVLYGADGEVLKTVSKFLGERTNNFAEYEAVVIGLEALVKIFGKNKLRSMSVDVKMDSQLVARQLSHEYQIKEPTLFPQYMRVHNLVVSVIPNISFIHVPREENKVADKLANEAMDRGHL
jgi:ribonuclease HI